MQSKRQVSKAGMEDPCALFPLLHTAGTFTTRSPSGLASLQDALANAHARVRNADLLLVLGEGAEVLVLEICGMLLVVFVLFVLQ